MQMIGCCYFHENGNLRMLNLFDVAVVDGSMGTAVFLLDSLPAHVFCLSFTTRATSDRMHQISNILRFAHDISPLYIYTYLRFDRWLHCTTDAACDACELNIHKICFFLFWLIPFSREKERMWKKKERKRKIIVQVHLLLFQYQYLNSAFSRIRQSCKNGKSLLDETIDYLLKTRALFCTVLTEYRWREQRHQFDGKRETDGSEIRRREEGVQHRSGRDRGGGRLHPETQRGWSNQPPREKRRWENYHHVRLFIYKYEIFKSLRQGSGERVFRGCYSTSFSFSNLDRSFRFDS